MTHSRRRRWIAAAGSGLTAVATTAALLAGPITPAVAAAAGAAATQAGSPAPVVRLIAAQRTITVGSYGGFVYLDPGIYVASLGSALEFHVQRASYARPVTITEVLHSGGRTVYRNLPDSVVRGGWVGLRGFIRLELITPRGRLVRSSIQPFCPNSLSPARVSPDSAMNSPFPQECNTNYGYDPFQKAMVWGIARGWAVDQNVFNGKLKLGTYRVVETITPRYRRLLHISAADARASVKVKVTKGEFCCFPARGHGPHPSQTRPAPLPADPAAPLLQRPPQDALPDLIPLPSWGISVSAQHPGRQGPVSDYLDFGATVWIGGHSPLDVEGFRSHGSQVMKAYQYFWRNGRLIGRIRVGTMGFAGYNHWHFQQFAQYRLLSASKRLVLRSHKEGFCIAPTDPIDLLIRGVLWQPQSTELFGQCGNPAALWVRELLPVGWGDTYQQFVPGEAFDITHIPNGTYYIEIIANPLRLLHETSTGNDISLRKVILGGTRDHRTVRVPAVHGIDPEHMGSAR